MSLARPAAQYRPGAGYPQTAGGYCYNLAMRRPLTASALAIAALLAAPAAAQVPGEPITVNPAAAGKASHLIIDIRTSDDPKAGGRAPESAILAAANGFKFDPHARTETCSADQAKANNCPGNSKIGSGTADATVSNGVVSQPVTADIEMFLTPPLKAGDVAGVVLHIKERSTGAQGNTSGRIVKTSGTFGIEVRFEDLAAANAAAPQGYTVRIDRIQADVGASHTEKVTKYKTVKTKSGKKKKVPYKVKVVHDLIRNPKTCAGSWPYQVRLRYSASDESVRDGSVTCSG
ncbi:MAG: hypothetical protein QOE06_2280 [Thermoleophilaceae bacterium]|nr:hypothetical protein [Thermoleophilaceae bacterium]